jgi:hypothetical protein
MSGAVTRNSSIRIGDTVRFRADAKHRDTLGPMADQVGIVVDVAEIDGVETLSVIYGDNGPLEAGCRRQSSRAPLQRVDPHMIAGLVTET